VPTLAAQTGPPRSTRKGRCAAHVSIWPTAAPLVRNSPRGWAPKALPNPEVHVGRARARGGIVDIVGSTLARRHASAGPGPGPGAGADAGHRTQTRERYSTIGYQQTASALPWCSAAAGTDDGTTPTALLPLNRIVVRDLGVHPRGEFRTSGAAVGQIDTRAASAAFLVERGGPV